MAKKILIRGAKAIVTCNERDEVYWDADMLLEGPRILKIGGRIHETYDELLDAGGKFVYPGLINTHHHFFQTFVRNLTTIDYPNMTVPEWIETIYRVFQHIDGEVIFYASLTAMADLIKHGCTCAFDHQYCYTPATGKTAVDRQMDAAALLGIRYHAGRGVNTLPQSEGSRIPDAMCETTEAYLEDCERLIAKYHDPKPYAMTQIVMAPCQPMNCYPETFTETVKLARSKGVRMHTHLGEGENAYMEAHTGKRTLAWCESMGFAGEDVWVAHAWELTGEEYTRLGELGMGISHCPTPAVLGGFPILPMKALAAKGVNVSLGCDGSATNDGSSLLDAMRLAWLMQAWHSKARGGCIFPYDMLKAATAGGAKTLGRKDLGSLAPGKGADLFMVDTTGLELAGTLHDPKNLLARGGVTGEVAMSMINGRVVFQNGVLTGVDEKKLAREGEEVCTRVLRKPCKVFHNLM